MQGEETIRLKEKKREKKREKQNRETLETAHLQLVSNRRDVEIGGDAGNKIASKYT